MDGSQAFEALDKLNNELEELVNTKKISQKDEFQFKVIYAQKKSFIRLTTSFYLFEEIIKKFKESKGNDPDLESNKSLVYGLKLYRDNAVSFILLHEAFYNYVNEVRFEYKPMQDAAKDFFDYVLADKNLLDLISKLMKFI